MSAYEIGQLIGSLLGGVLGLVIVFCLLVAIFFWPLMAWSAMRSLKGIHRELQRLNNDRPAEARRLGTGTLGL